MTDYYVDKVNGDDSWNGLFPTPGTPPDGPWENVNKFPDKADLAAGDVGWVRRNQTHTPAAYLANMSANGTVDNPITLKGDDGSVGAWSGDDDVRPIIDWGNVAGRYLFLFRSNWRWENLHFKNNGDTTYGQIRHSNQTSLNNPFKNCKFEDHRHVAKIVDGLGLEFEDCPMVDADDGSCHFLLDGGHVSLVGCPLDGPGAQAFDIKGGGADCKDCGFGKNAAFVNSNVFAEGAGVQIWLRNCNHGGSPTAGPLYVSEYARHAAIYSEDHGKVQGANQAIYQMGTVAKSGTARPGGADSSAAMAPNNRCAKNNPLTVSQDLLGGDFKLWLPASEQTVTIYIRSISTWGDSYPTADELYIQAEYLSDGSTGARAASTKSVQVLSDGTTWVAFTTTFTPAAEGWVYVSVFLGKYASGQGVYVDIRPEVA